jgi:hypothetical protein
MNLAHLHLLTNHLPIIGIPFALILLIHGFWKGNLATQKFSLLAMVLFSLMVLPVYFTGDPAEDAVENIPGVQKRMIHDHEESGEVSMVLTLVTGGAALVSLALLQKKSRIPKQAVWSVMALAVISSASLAYTGSLGGVIRHTEVRGDKLSAAPAESSAGPSSSQNE